MNDQESVLATVAQIIRELIGEEWANDIEIGMGTAFSEDLELESIEFVALAERLRATYGEDIDFATWLAGMDLQQILGLHVGDLVNYIVQCKSSAPTASS